MKIELLITPHVYLPDGHEEFRVVIVLLEHAYDSYLVKENFLVLENRADKNDPNPTTAKTPKSSQKT